MAPKTNKKDIILNIITRLKSDKLRDHTVAMKKITKEYGNWSTFLKEVSLQRRGALISDRAELNYFKAKSRIQRNITRSRMKDLKAAKVFSARLGYNLSLLFFSMKVSRQINSTLKDWFSNYNKIVQGQTNFANKTNELSAAFSFLKFVIVDTFSRNKFVQQFVDLFVKLANNVAKFVSAHPTISLGIVMGGVTIMSLATLIEWVAQISLLFNALDGLKKAGTISTTFSLTANIAKDFKDYAAYFTGAKEFKKLSVTAKMSVAITELYLAYEAAKVLAPFFEDLGKEIRKKMSELFGEEFTTHMQIVVGESLYNILSAFGPLGDMLLKIGGTSLDELKRQVEDMKFVEKLKEIQDETGQVLLTPEQYKKALEESKVTSFWEDVSNAMDPVLDKMDKLIEKQSKLANIPFAGFIDVSSYTNYEG